jgi:hypothetical protein
MTRSLLQALGMPFQLTSLLFVLACALLLSLAFAVAAGSAGLAISLLALVVVLIWLVQYAYVVLDAAANGLIEMPAASAELLSPFADERGWIHPFLIAATTTSLILNPGLPKWPSALTVALFFPASIAATVISGKALDALNPFAITRVLMGMGSWFALPVFTFLLCAGGCLVIASMNGWLFLRLAVMGLLVLLAYASVGGVLYARRNELGFTPRISPERIDEKQASERLLRRQQWIDSLYQLVLVREHTRAASTARQWLANTEPHELPDDIAALLVAGRTWSQGNSYCQLLRSVISHLLEQQRPALALQVTEAGLSVAAGFAMAEEAAAVALARYALQTSRKKLAATILDNHLAIAGKADTGPALLALQQQLREALRP